MMQLYNIVSKNPEILYIKSEALKDRLDSTFYVEFYQSGLNDIENNNIKIKSLKDATSNIVDGPFGSAILSDDYANEGVPFLRVKNVKDCMINYSDLVFITEQANQKIKRSECRPGDVVFTKTGWLGLSSVVPNDYSKYNIRGDLARIKINHNELDSHYLVAYLNSKIGQKVVYSYRTGSTRARIILSNLRKVPVPIPSIEVQKYIGNKIREAESLREEAIEFKKKSVINLNEFISEFMVEPVDKINNLNGEQGYEVINENPSSVWINTKNLDDRIDPKYYHYNYLKIELRNFEKQNYLIQCLNYFETGLNSFKSGNISVKRLKTKNIQNESIRQDELLDVEINKKNNDKILKKGDVVLTTYGTGSLGKVAYIYKDTNWVPDYTIAIMRTKENIDPAYLMTFLSSEYGQVQIMRRVNGTTGITFVLKSQLETLKIPIPPYKVQKQIGDKLRKFYKKLDASKKLVQEAKQDVEDLIEGKLDIEDIK